MLILTLFVEKNTPKCIIRGQEIAANTDENSRGSNEMEDREKD